MIIAIDGPAASGKSTVAKLLARRLDFDHFDTGSMYRAVTWLALKKKVDVSDEKALTKLCKNWQITYVANGASKKIFAAGCDVTGKIRSTAVEAKVSLVAKVPEVRELLVKEQRKIGEKGNFVVEGRDVGTVVFPK